MGRSRREAPVWIGALIGLAVGTSGCSSPSHSEELGAFAEDPAQRRCLALAMYWEAKAEGRRGMRAVGHVVANRVADPRFPRTPCGVVKQGGEQPGCQFSWYCDGRSDVPREEGHWRTARQLADELLAGELKDLTDGALFFHASRLENPWRVEREKTIQIGNHVFYR